MCIDLCCAMCYVMIMGLVVRMVLTGELVGVGYGIHQDRASKTYFRSSYDICLPLTIMMIKECVEAFPGINCVNNLTFIHSAFSSESSNHLPVRMHNSHTDSTLWTPQCIEPFPGSIVSII